MPHHGLPGVCSDTRDVYVSWVVVSHCAGAATRLLWWTERNRVLLHWNPIVRQTAPRHTSTSSAPTLPPNFSDFGGCVLLCVVGCVGCAVCVSHLTQYCAVWWPWLCVPVLLCLAAVPCCCAALMVCSACLCDQGAVAAQGGCRGATARGGPSPHASPARSQLGRPTPPGR